MRQAMDPFHQIHPDYIPVSSFEPNQARRDPRMNNDVESNGTNCNSQAKNCIEPYQSERLDNLSGRLDETIEGACYWDNAIDASLGIVPNMTEGQDALSKHKQCPWSGTHFSDTLSSATNSDDVDFSFLNHLEQPYNAYKMGDSLNMFPWGSTEQAVDQSSQAFSISRLFKDDTNLVNHDALDCLDMGCSTSQPFKYRVPEDRIDTEQGEASTSVPKQLANKFDLNKIVCKIGSVLNNGRFMCDYEKCAGRTFARQAELRRHYTTLHAAEKPNFWCQVSSCQRSTSAGGEPFHRKDKLAAHVRSMHPDVQ